MSYTHYRSLLSLKNDNEIDYYINISINQNLSVRELQKRIKHKEYERLDEDKTIGIIIVKKDNKFIMEYCSDNRILTREYELL